MAKQVQFRRGTTAEHSGFTGAVGEATVDTSLNTIRVHDGSTAGGTRLARYSEIANAAQLNAAQSFSAGQRGAIVTLSDGATITPDFDAGNNFSVTISGNRTLANPSNINAGQSGTIVITNAGANTLAFGSYWKFPGGTAPAVTASGTDLLVYYCDGASRISANLVANLS